MPEGIHRDIWLIGVGTGSLRHITLDGLEALRRASVILVPQKGSDKGDLAEIRKRIIADSGSQAQVIFFDYPTRDPALPYYERVARWHDEIAARWKDTLADASEGPVALLVWGDPGLYDSTIRIAERLVDRARITVFAGITALQALTAAHVIPFNTVNGTVVVTTGRRLREDGWPEGAETVVVMLDGACSFQTLDPEALHIWWGAFLGMPEQILDHGPLVDAAPRIVERRAQAREAHGWIMDTYLLRRSPR